MVGCRVLSILLYVAIIIYIIWIIRITILLMLRSVMNRGILMGRGVSMCGGPMVAWSISIGRLLAIRYIVIISKVIITIQTTIMLLISIITAGIIIAYISIIFNMTTSIKIRIIIIMYRGLRIMLGGIYIISPIRRLIWVHRLPLRGTSFRVTGLLNLVRLIIYMSLFLLGI